MTDAFYLVLPVRVDDERVVLAFSVLSDLLLVEVLAVVVLAGAELTLELLLELLVDTLLARVGAVLLTADLLVVLRVF